MLGVGFEELPVDVQPLTNTRSSAGVVGERLDYTSGEDKGRRGKGRESLGVS